MTDHLPSRLTKTAPLCCMLTRGLFHRSNLGEILQDWAVRSAVALAMGNKGAQRADHRLQLGDLGLQSRNVIERQLLHVGTGPRVVAP